MVLLEQTRPCFGGPESNLSGVSFYRRNGRVLLTVWAYSMEALSLGVGFFVRKLLKPWLGGTATWCSVSSARSCVLVVVLCGWEAGRSQW